MLQQYASRLRKQSQIFDILNCILESECFVLKFDISVHHHCGLHFLSCCHCDLSVLADSIDNIDEAKWTIAKIN